MCGDPDNGQYDLLWRTNGSYWEYCILSGKALVRSAVRYPIEAIRKGLMFHLDWSRITITITCNR